MKKFSIKSLLVLVLALVLALSLVLVACNDNEEPEPEPAGYTASDYFTKLWDLSKSIGNETIADNQNIAVSADLGVELAVKSSTNNAVTKKIAVGFAIDAVLDRHNLRTDGTFTNSDVSKDTALKIKVYDMATGENWATVYYFIGDEGNLYIDFAGQNIILPFDYANDQLGSWLSKTIFEDQTMVVYDQEMQNGYVYEKVEGKDEYQKYYYIPEGDNKGWYKGTSTDYPDVYYKGKAAIGSILTTLSQKMGADWNLNVLVNDVLNLIKRSTQMDLTTTVGGLATSILQIPARDVYDTNGNLNLEKILTGGKLGSLLFSKPATPKTENGVTTYRINFNTTGVLGTAIEMASPLLTKLSVLSLEFQEKDNAIQNFSIKADLRNLATSDREYPSLTVSINELKFRGVDQNKTSDVVKMETTKDKYSPEVALDFAVALDVDGITIKPSLINNRNTHFENVPDIVLDGQLVVALKGKLDLANKENNGTNALATISYKAKGATAAAPLLSASFVGNRLAVTVNQDLTVKTTATTDAGAAVEVPLAKTLVNCFGGYVFNGVQSMFYTELGDNDVIAEDSKYEYFTVSLDGEVYKYNKFASVTDAIAAKANGTKVFCSKDGGYNVLNQFANVFFAKDGDNLNYFDINEKFVGGVWNNINIVPLFQKGVNKIVEMLGGNGLVKFDAGTSVDLGPTLTKIANTITKVIPLFTTGTDGVTITVDNVNNVISNIGREFDDNMSAEGNVNSIVSWDTGSWIPDIAKLLVIKGATYTNEKVQGAISVTDADIEAYKNAERAKYAYHHYTVSEDRIVAARNVYKNKDDEYIRKALASNDFNAAITKDKITTEEYNAIVTAVDASILAAEKESGRLRFIGKEKADIIARVQPDEAFMSELLSASAVVKINMSGSTGFSLAINAKVADATVGISISVGAHKTTTGEFADLAKDVTADSHDGWFYYAFAA